MHKTEVNNMIYLDKQAFDELYQTVQKIGDIAARAIKEGDRGHKKAIHEIMRICRSVE